MKPKGNAAMFSPVCQAIASKGQMSFADRLMAAHIFGIEAYPEAGESLTSTLGMFLSVLPDMQIAVGDIIINGATVLCQVSISGTHKGEFMGISPTGQQVAWAISLIYTTSGEKLCEAWVNNSAISALQQPQPVETAV